MADINQINEISLYGGDCQSTYFGVKVDLIDMA
jgi:hypothetical protein